MLCEAITWQGAEPRSAGLLVYKSNCQSFWICQLRDDLSLSLTIYMIRRRVYYLGILGSLVFGGVAGWLTGTIVRGSGISGIGNVILGMTGGFIGGWLLSLVQKQES